jgi:hypothetical protein
MQHQPWVSPQLRRVINKAVRPEPDKRFTSAKAMCDALAAARYVDWKTIAAEPDLRRWEGGSVHRPDRRFAVEAKRRKGHWQLIGQQQVSSWRRMTERPDAIVPSLTGSQATAFFDSMVTIATKR